MEDVVLMAYVDGELPPRERQEVEKLFHRRTRVAASAMRQLRAVANRLVSGS